MERSVFSQLCTQCRMTAGRLGDSLREFAQGVPALCKASGMGRRGEAPGFCAKFVVDGGRKLTYTVSIAA